ncbi:MAG: 30S ribosomal protein S20 [Planctomycetaceae bacterium]
MPNNVNAAKAMRQANKRRLRNRAAKSALRKVIKKMVNTADSATAETVTTVFNQTASKIDKMAAKKFMHANKAARLKSRLAKRANAKKTGKTP